MWFQNPENKQKVFLGALLVGAFSLHIAPAVASISTIIVLVIGLMEFMQCSEAKHRRIQGLFGLLFALMFISDVVAGTSVSEAFKGVQVMLPLFLLPAILSFKLGDRWQLLTALGLAIPLWWISGASLLNYLTDYEFLSQMVLESKPLPLFSKVYHIEFSMLTSVVLLVLLGTIINHKTSGIWRTTLVILCVLLFLALHVMSARTGLIVFWSGALLLLGSMYKHVFSLKRLIPLALFSFSVVVLLLWFAVPSFQNRVKNTKEDLSAVLHGGDLNHKSFGQRVEAWRASIYVISQDAKLIRGTGTQNFDAALLESYDRVHTTLNQSNRIGPHNQWLQWFATYGWGVGLAWVLLLLGVVCVYFDREYVLLALIPVVSASMVESIAQRQAGVFAWILFWFWIRQFQEYRRNIKKISSIN